MSLEWILFDEFDKMEEERFSLMTGSIRDARVFGRVSEDTITEDGGDFERVFRR